MPEDTQPSEEGLVGALARLAVERIGGAEVFGTFTFRDPPARPGSPLYTSVGHGGAVRAIESHLRGLAEVYPGVAAFMAMEPHADRVAPHLHGLLAGLGPGVAAAVEAGRHGRRPAAGSGFAVAQATDRLWRSWFDDYGIARLEEVKGDGAGLYVSKYSMKGGNDIPWFRIWEPGELRNDWVRASRRKVRR